MAKIDSAYHGLLEKIKDEGFKYEDPNRKGVYRYQIPSYQMVHNFADGFPAITTKKLYWKGVVGELLWFLRGDTNIKYLDDNKIYIWHKDGYNHYLNKGGKLNYGLWKLVLNCDLHGKFGDLDRVYGAQWRKWKGKLELKRDPNTSSGHIKADLVFSKIDQISNLIKGLKETPMGTKHIVTAWNPAELDNMALPPCHWSFEILVEPIKGSRERNKQIRLAGSKLQYPLYQFTLKWHQRSVDTFLGLPFNIASYATLAQIIGKITNMVPKGIIGDLSNVHIYESHMDAVNQQLENDTDKYGKCELLIDYDTENMLMSSGRIFGKLPKEEQSAYLDKILSQINISDFTLKGYESFPPISAEMLPYNK
jgi:thymidylate synthase